MADAPDTARSAPIDDHPFIPRGEWWTLCRVCGLGEAAHIDTTSKVPDDSPNPHR